MLKLGSFNTLILSAFCISACTTESPQNNSNPYLTLGEHLASCKAYSEEFQHPFTKSTEERKIVGFEGDKCIYVESLPNNGEMRCEYSEALRTSVANYYKSITLPATFSSTEKTPLREAMDAGVCTISGY